MACVSAARPSSLSLLFFNMRVSFHTLKFSFAFCAALLATDWSFSSSLVLAKRKRVFTDTPQPDPEREEGRVQLQMPSVGKEFAEELANASKASARAKHWYEYQRVSNALVQLLEREAKAGTRVLYFNLINAERQFQQGPSGDLNLNRYGEVLEFMLKGKGGGMPLKHDEEGGIGKMLGCVPQRERWCVENIARAARTGTWLTVENCHRWKTASALGLAQGAAAAHKDFEQEFKSGFGPADLSIDWQEVCQHCYSERVQTSVRVVREDGILECLQLPDEESGALTAQIPGNWTIDVSTRTTIGGGMRMEERKMLPIGGRWISLSSIHKLILSELVEGNVHIRPLLADDAFGPPLTTHRIRDNDFEVATDGVFDYAILLW